MDRNNPDISELEVDSIQPASLYFRKSALAAKKPSGMQPAAFSASVMWPLAALLFTFIVASVYFLSSVKYARRETVSGQIVPRAGAARIHPTINGVTTRLFVKEGDFIQAGRPLALVSSNQALSGGQLLEQSLKSVQQLQEKAIDGQIKARLAQVQEQIEEQTQRQSGLRADIANCAEVERILSRRLALQRETYAAHKDLADTGAVSKASLRQQEDALLGVRQQLEQVKRDKAQQQSQVAQISHQLGRLQAEAELAKSELENTREELRARQLNSDAQLSASLVAPVSGFVTAISTHAGATVTADQTVAVIVPASDKANAGPLEAELWAPSRAIGFVKPGAKVRLMYDAFPVQTFGTAPGVVLDVAGSPTLPKDIPLPLEAREPLFKIRVGMERGKLSAYGQEWTLAPGMRLTADVVLEERSLFDIIFEPVRAARNRFLK